MTKLKRLVALVFQSSVPDPAGSGPTDFQRFPLPHTFKPRLSFIQALTATLGAVLRILCSCVLFAIWGAYSIFVWSTVPNYFSRLAILFFVLALFVLSLAVLMISISALVRIILLRLS